MARIFIFDGNPDTIRSVGRVLESRPHYTEVGHTVYSNLIGYKDPKTGFPRQRLITNPIDVMKVYGRIRPLPEIILADCSQVNGIWLCGLLKDCGLADNALVVLMTHNEQDKKILHTCRLYQAQFIRKPFNIHQITNLVDDWLSVEV